MRLFLPLYDGVAVPAPAPGLAGLRGTVVLVEDEEAVRSLAAEALAELGWQVLEAASGPGGAGVAVR